MTRPAPVPAGRGARLDLIVVVDERAEARDHSMDQAVELGLDQVDPLGERVNLRIRSILLRADLAQQLEHEIVRFLRHQNISAGIAITASAPAWMRARCVPVSGSIRSMKKRPARSLASMRAAAPSPSVFLACAAFAILAHI